MSSRQHISKRQAAYDTVGLLMTGSINAALIGDKWRIDAEVLGIREPDSEVRVELGRNP